MEKNNIIKTNSLVHGDCIEAMKCIADQSIDMVLTDPPYGKTSCKWDSIIPIEPMWEQLKRVTKKNGAIVLFGSQPFTSNLIISNPKMFKYEWIWEKNKVTGFLNAKKQPMRKHEQIIVFYDKQCLYNPQKTNGHKPVNSYTKHTSDGETVGKTKIGITGGGSTERYPQSIIKFNVVNQDGTSDKGNFHPSQKPIALMEYLIKTYSNENDIILDFAMGVFTTPIACLNTKRNFIGIEKDYSYFMVGKNRIEQHILTLDYVPELIFC